MIYLRDIFEFPNPGEYKLHIAKYNGSVNPLDDFMENFDYWVGWNCWRSEKVNRFNRPYILAFLDFYPQPGRFLFGGIFKVVKTYADHYDLELCESYSGYIGRLKVENIHTGRGSSFRLENFIDDIQVAELLDESYAVHAFPGYENLDYSFSAIRSVVQRQPADWKTALENVKGVYMLTDTANGRRYIGSAYSDCGIWSRWCQYCANGHGGNDELARLVEQKGYDYVCRSFKFTLLEIHSRFTPDDFIIRRESYWKNVMLSREKRFGYNDN